MADRRTDMGSSDQRARMSELRLELIETGWTVFHPEPHSDRWFVAACKLHIDEDSGTARVGAGTTPLEAMERVRADIMGRR